MRTKVFQATIAASVLLGPMTGIAASAALKHHFVNHDDILRRMLPRSRATTGAHPSARGQELT